MNHRQRLECLEKGAERHTCGLIVVVDFDQELPPPRPPCKACELELRRTGRRRITFMRFCAPVRGLTK
jgi:hypothetical protein